MRDLTLVDPELRKVLAFLPPMQVSNDRLPEMRGMAAEMPLPEPNPAVSCEELRIPGQAGAPSVRILAYKPKAPMPGLRAAILGIHGGGYIFGMPEMDRWAHQSIAAELGCIIVAVDYRLAPETPFPGALEDCHAVLTWLHGQAEALNVDPKRIGVSGMSAGGGLAAALALYVRDRGEQLLAFQHLIYPMIDDRTCVRAPNPHQDQLIWTSEANRFGWSALLGTAPGGTDISPYAAAARATDLRNLPSTYLAVGALDLFLQENLDYANRLANAGVPIEAHIYPGAFHGFYIAQQTAVGRAAVRDSLAALARFCA